MVGQIRTGRAADRPRNLDDSAARETADFAELTVLRRRRLRPRP
ncbi:hypothetical protein [Streptomyces sp. AC550_RSS872]|nr:hypothetical protein [Streptomyces sp. AC550_RSS872]